jgi:hypothetical protein
MQVFLPLPNAVRPNLWTSTSPAATNVSAMTGTAGAAAQNATRAATTITPSLFIVQQFGLVLPYA